MIKYSGFIYILLLCINTIIRNKSNFGIEFEFRGLFYITFLYFLFGLYVSESFRKIIYSNTNLLIWFFLILSIINGFINQNEFYYIKEDFYKILTIYVGMLTPLLIYNNSLKVNSSIIALISTFYFAIILYFMLKGLINFGGTNSIYSLIQILSMFFPLLVFQYTRNKYLNYPNQKYFILILIILLYETFVSFTRMNIIGILLSVLVVALLTKMKRNFSYNLSVLKNFIAILLLLLTAGPFLWILKTGFVDRTFSDSFRLFEAAYLYQNYISESIVFGSGFGKTFFTPLTNDVEMEAHIGFITILLKFGILGFIIVLLLILRPFFKLFFYSDLRKLNKNNWVVLIAPALAFWFISLMVGKGTFPEQLFGLGLLIGCYFQFKNSMILNNYI